MRMLIGRRESTAVLCLVAAMTAASAARDQQQAPGTRANWPCGARIDPTYFQLAEGTGGEMWLIAPWEIADSAALLEASARHSRTIFRLGGTINPGPHEFRVPIDPSVESVMFSISVQCLQAAEVMGPSGEPAAGNGVTDVSGFAAERMVIVTRPAAGIWTIRAAGSGLAGVMVKARSALGITGVEFAPPGAAGFSPLPSAGVENVVRIDVTGHPARVEAAIVNAASRDIAVLTLAPADSDGTYTARFTPGSEAFRVLIRGQDAGGAPFQRVHPPLLMTR
jgi:hypothetical protein